MVPPTAMLEDAFAGFRRQIQATEIGVAILEQVDDPKALTVVIEAAVVLHQFSEDRFAGMPKGRVAQVVRQHDRFGEIFVEPECSGDRASDLRRLDRMRQSISVVVLFEMNEDLRLELETPEGTRMNDPVPVALKRGPIGMGLLRHKTAEGIA